MSSFVERWDATIYLQDGRFVEAKLLMAGKPEIAAESLAYVLGRFLDSPLLSSYQVQVSREYLLDSLMWENRERERLAFAYGKPPNRVLLRTTESFDLSLIAEWRHLPAVCLLDQLLGNARQMSDLMFDGKNFYLTDHFRAECVRIGQLWSEDFAPGNVELPILDHVSKLWSSSDRALFGRRVRALCARLQALDFAVVASAARLPLILGDEASTRVADYLYGRTTTVCSALYQRLGIPALRIVK